MLHSHKWHKPASLKILSIIVFHITACSSTTSPPVAHHRLAPLWLTRTSMDATRCHPRIPINTPSTSTAPPSTPMSSPVSGWWRWMGVGGVSAIKDSVPSATWWTTWPWSTLAGQNNPIIPATGRGVYAKVAPSRPNISWSIISVSIRGRNRSAARFPDVTRCLRERRTWRYTREHTPVSWWHSLCSCGFGCKFHNHDIWNCLPLTFHELHAGPVTLIQSRIVTSCFRLFLCF